MAESTVGNNHIDYTDLLSVWRMASTSTTIMSKTPTLTTIPLGKIWRGKKAKSGIHISTEDSKTSNDFQNSKSQVLQMSSTRTMSISNFKICQSQDIIGIDTWTERKKIKDQY